MSVVDLVIYAVLALLGAVGGWIIRQAGASAREAALKREVLDAKAAIPQLESSVRNRDQQIATLETQVSSLKERAQELSATIDQQSSEIVGRDRQLRDAKSELNILKTGAEGDAPLYGDDTDAPKAGDADLVERVTRAEQRYESLKRGLIERDDRITQLEAELAGGGASAAGASPEALDALESAKSQLEADLAARDAQIKQLSQRLEEEAERREVLESLAKTRGEAKVEQRERLATLEAELPQLKRSLDEKDAMIEQRVATIAALRKDVARLDDAKARAEGQVVDLTAKLDAQARAIAEHDGLMATLNQTLEAHKTQIESLKARNTRTDDAVREAEARVAERDAQIVNLKSFGSEVQGTADSLKRTISDRDFKIETLEGELTKLTQELAKVRAQLSAATEASGPDPELARLATETSQLRQRTIELERENDRLENEVRTLTATPAAPAPTESPEQERALVEREQRIHALESALRDAQGHVDVLAREKAEAEAAVRELEQSASERANGAAPAPATDAAPLPEAEQRIRSLENLLKDRDFRIDGLLQDVAALEAKLAVYRSEDGFEADGASEAAAQ